MAQARLSVVAGVSAREPHPAAVLEPSQDSRPYVREGMTVLEPGPGIGYFTLELARQVGPSGRVTAVDLQPRMLEGLKRRAAKAGLLDRVDPRLAAPESLGVGDLAGTVDFVLAFAMVHEMPSAEGFFAEAAPTLKPNGTLLLAEPTGHVSSGEFESELRAAAQAGLTVAVRPSIPHSHAALLKKT